MSEVLNLNMIPEKTFPVKFLDYEINLLPCSIKNLRRYSKLAETSTEEEVMSLALETLNHNKEGIIISEKVVAEMSLAQRDILLTRFFEWQQQIRLKNPNL